MTQKENFMYEQQKAVERMMEMNRRSKPDGNSHNMPPAPSFVKLNENASQFKDSNTPKKLDTALSSDVIDSATTLPSAI